MPGPYQRFGKRGLDLVLAGTATVVLAPAMLPLALAVWRQLGRPVLFVQRRPGRNGRLFPLLKLRTMNDARDHDGRLRPDAERLGPLGRVLRRYALDELPSLLNVLRGDMSLVGPRPLLPEYLPCYSPREAQRHRVRPGLTGWAQVHGRNAVSWDERLSLDVWYVEHVSLALDVRILVRTVGVVLRGRGAQAPGHATMPRLDHVRGPRR